MSGEKCAGIRNVETKDQRLLEQGHSMWHHSTGRRGIMIHKTNNIFDYTSAGAAPLTASRSDEIRYGAKLHTHSVAPFHRLPADQTGSDLGIALYTLGGTIPQAANRSD